MKNCQNANLILLLLSHSWMRAEVRDALLVVVVAVIILGVIVVVVVVAFGYI